MQSSANRRLCEPLDPEVAPCGEQHLQAVLRHLCLARVDELQDAPHLRRPDTVQVDQRVLVVGFPQDLLEEVAGGGEDEFVGGDLAVLAGKGHVEEITGFSQLECDRVTCQSGRVPNLSCQPA